MNCAGGNSRLEEQRLTPSFAYWYAYRMLTPTHQNTNQKPLRKNFVQQGSRQERARTAQWLDLALLMSISVLLIATLALPFGRPSPHAGPNAGPEVWGFHLTLILIFSGAWLLLRRGFGFVEQSVADHSAKLTHTQQQLKQEILARQQSEQRLYSLAQSTHDLLCIWDEAGQKWSYCNHPEILRQWGWELPSYADLLHHLHPADQARVREVRTQRGTAFPHKPLEYRLCLHRDTLNRDALNRDAQAWLWVREQVLALDADKRPAQIVLALPDAIQHAAGIARDERATASTTSSP
jgi:hypothetical protein